MIVGLVCWAVCIQTSPDIYAAGYFDPRYLETEINQIIDTPDHVTVARCTNGRSPRTIGPHERLQVTYLGKHHEVSEVDRTEIRKLLRLPVNRRSVGNCSFSADHVIRFEKAGRTVIVVTCFSCKQQSFYIDGDLVTSPNYATPMADPVSFRNVLDRYSTEFEKAAFPIFREHFELFNLALAPIELQIRSQDRESTLSAQETRQLIELLFLSLVNPKIPAEEIASPLEELHVYDPASNNRIVIGSNLSSWQFYQNKQLLSAGTFGKWLGKAHLLLRRALTKGDKLARVTAAKGFLRQPTFH